MRIFSNFDTKLKKRSFHRYQQEYGIDNVVLLVKGKLFCLLKIFIPLMAFVFACTAILRMFVLLVGKNGLLYGGIPLVVLGPFLNRYIQYKMDFSIVTPKMLITYDQKGIFHRDIKTINAINIKTVSVEKAGVWYSLCNTGDLVFLSEGGEMGHGEITLHYIHKPEKVRHAIAKVLGRR